MDVRCGQCGTDYDFDDTLLSSRGTMVRCTTCGHQFKVFPARAVDAVTDRWLIEKSSGQQLVFTSLKDLQRAIGAGVVRRQDVLTRGGEVRQVGSIAELDSLFRKRQAPAHDPRTLMGIAPARAGSTGLRTREPAVSTETRPDAQPQSGSDEDDVTKVVQPPPDPPVPTPSMGVAIPEAARAAPAGRTEASEKSQASPRIAPPEPSPKARLLVEASRGEALPTPRSPTEPVGSAAVGAFNTEGQERREPDRVAAGRSVTAEATAAAGHGRYAETLRSEEAILSTASSAGPGPGSEQPANGSAPGAKPIARITTQRVAIRRERPGASTMRSSDWADGSVASLAGATSSDAGPPAPEAPGESSAPGARNAVEAAEPQKPDAEAEPPPKAAQEPQKPDAEAEPPPKAAQEPQKPDAEAEPPPKAAQEPQKPDAEAEPPPKAAQEPQKPNAEAEPPPKAAQEPQKPDVAAGESETAAVGATCAATGAEKVAPSKAAEAEAGAAKAGTEEPPSVPEARGDEPAQRARDEAVASVRVVPHATAAQPAGVSPAKPGTRPGQTASHDAKESPPATKRQRQRPVSAEPAAQGGRQRGRAPATDAHPRRARGWLGLTAAIAALAGAAYLSAPIWLPPAGPSARTPPEARGSAQLDACVDRARQLMDAGNLAAAKQQLDSALNLKPNDARVLAETARWQLETAELAWWRSRMYGPAEGALAQTAREDLRAKLGSAKSAVERAESVGAPSVSLRWARSALDRMAGNLADARKHMAALAQTGLVAPDYDQAALAVASGSSDWAMAAQQLVKTASVETYLGPSRFGLVFVLASSGRLDEARARLDATTRQSATEPLFQELESFVHRSSTAASGSPDTGTANDAGTTESSTALDGDFRRQLTGANDALRAGHISRAERLFRSVLDTVPGNSEALSGLADVARARNDSATASQMYQRVLESNPGYLPALIALADQKWQAGDRRGASAYYRRVLEQAGPASSYGARASQRLREMEKGAASELLADAGQPATPRSSELSDRPSQTGGNASRGSATSNSADAQPSGRASKPRKTGSHHANDFVP
jgi:predicted Zn finger-like uncharacterized protein